MSHSLVRNGTLIEGTGKAPLPDAAVLIKDNCIESIGRADRIGTVEPGKLADIVIAKTDPLKDIRSLENPDNIAAVMKDGKRVKDRRDGERHGRSVRS